MKRRSKKSGDNAIAAGKAFAEMIEVGESSEARYFFPAVDWSTVPPERERMISKRLSEALARIVSEGMDRYRNSVEFLELQEKTRQHWLKAGIDIRKHADGRGRLRLLVAKACPDLLPATFDLDSWFFQTKPSEWFPAIFDAACQNEEKRKAAATLGQTSKTGSAVKASNLDRQRVAFYDKEKAANGRITQKEVAVKWAKIHKDECDEQGIKNAVYRVKHDGKLKSKK